MEDPQAVAGQDGDFTTGSGGGGGGYPVEGGWGPNPNVGNGQGGSGMVVVRYTIPTFSSTAKGTGGIVTLPWRKNISLISLSSAWNIYKSIINIKL